eukprot:TRINITY_DN5487_c1_g2_i1.p1 TRINITY_DN5487_c1_g2~~TRINITY_DN5487_c1_g2_i1.p1  ORF type:complete len:186 (-),score=31.44 TRINITY_DN5487_c1_g2_i1:6-563(-)
MFRLSTLDETNNSSDWTFLFFTRSYVDMPGTGKARDVRFHGRNIVLDPAMFEQINNECVVENIPVELINIKKRRGWGYTYTPKFVKHRFEEEMTGTGKARDVRFHGRNIVLDPAMFEQINNECVVENIPVELINIKKRRGWGYTYTPKFVKHRFEEDFFAIVFEVLQYYKFEYFTEVLSLDTIIL